MADPQVVYIVTCHEPYEPATILSVWSSLDLAFSAVEAERARLGLTWHDDEDWSGWDEGCTSRPAYYTNSGRDDRYFEVHSRPLG